jgi:ribosomal protein L37AE/L43A
MDSLHRAPGADGASPKPLHLCPNCAAYVIAATRSERVSDRCIRNIWSCEACGFEFETSAYIPVKPTSN